MVSEVDQGLCHSLLAPYKTLEFQGKVEKPLFIISYKGPGEFTFSFSSDTNLSEKNGVLIVIDNSDYILETNYYKKSAITYSIEQDVSIMNGLIYGPDSFQIRTNGKKGEINSHHFHTAGLKEAVIYMQNHCKK